jgi:tight adherence protein C
MILLAILSVVLIGTSIGLLGWVVILPRTRGEARVREIQAYGFGGVGAVEERPPRSLAASVALLAGRLGELISRGSAGGIAEDALRKELMTAGLYRVSPRMIAGYRVICAALGITVGLSYELILPGIAGHIVTAGALGYCGWLIPLVLVRRRARARLDEIDRRLPDLIDLMVVTVEAGVGFGGSLQIAAGRMDGPLAQELRLTLQEQRMGLELRESLQNMLERANVPAMRSFVRAVTQGEALGVSIATIMRNLAVEMRKRRRAQAEEQTQKAPVKMLFPLVFLIFPALGIVIMGPAAFDLADFLGRQ